MKKFFIVFVKVVCGILAAALLCGAGIAIARKLQAPVEPDDPTIDEPSDKPGDDGFVNTEKKTLNNVVAFKNGVTDFITEDTIILSDHQDFCGAFYLANEDGTKSAWVVDDINFLVSAGAINITCHTTIDEMTTYSGSFGTIIEERIEDPNDPGSSTLTGKYVISISTPVFSDVMNAEGQPETAWLYCDALAEGQSLQEWILEVYDMETPEALTGTGKILYYLTEQVTIEE